MRRYRLSSLPTEILLGPGASTAVGEEIARLGASRALVVTTAGRHTLGERIAREIGARAAGVLAIAEEHVPIEVAERGRREARDKRADALVSVGGGSATGLAKAMALTQCIPIVAVPCTYSGSEMTPVWGLTEAGVKTTGRDDRVRAAAALYDPLLSRHLPPKVAVPSAFNALAHAVETLYAPGAPDDVLGWAEAAVGHLVGALPALAAGSDDLASRERALEGACLAGACLGRATMGLHHKLCHVLGGTFGLPHAETHAALLPFVVRFNLEAAPEARERLARILGVSDPSNALLELARTSGVTLGLEKLGLAESRLDHVAELAMETPYPNPRVVQEVDLRALLMEAFRG